MFGIYNLYNQLSSRIMKKNTIRILAIMIGVIISPFSFISAQKHAQLDETEILLKDLCNLSGTCSFEQQVREYLTQKWSDLGATIKVDGLGNLIATINENSTDKPVVLVMAHMDEVGFMISDITDDGFIKVRELGGWSTHVLWGHIWNIQVGKISIAAISGFDSNHVLTDFSTTPSVSADQLFFDTGLSKEELIKKGVRPGIPITPLSEFRVLVPSSRYTAKAFDDRASLAVMTQLMKDIKENPAKYNHLKIVFAATVEEELGIKGAPALAGSVSPNYVINLEAGIAKDYPTQFSQGHSPVLGGGPALFIYDGSMLPDPKLVSFISEVAENNNIPFQWESEISYGQDASAARNFNGGCSAINIGIPIRYNHSHYGIMDRRDYDNTLLLLKKTLRSLK